jgi:hypothetical protein
MEPRIQYAKTTDGVSIAFATMAEGTPPRLAGDRTSSEGGKLIA